MKKNKNIDWDEVLSAAARLQGHLPEAVLVGGTASAIFAAHRISHDADHVLPNLREEFDEILKILESVAGWKTARTKQPVLILGSLDGIETGVRQLIRTAPLETTEVFIRGQKIKVPTEGEVLRIKAALILKRNATRDYLDFAALSRHLDVNNTTFELKNLDRLYPQPNGESALHQLYVQLANPKPFDLELSSLATYKNLSDEWKVWENVAGQCRQTACALLDIGRGRDLEQQAQEVQREQIFLNEATDQYNRSLIEYTQAKVAQCERLEALLEKRVALQQSQLAQCEQNKPNLLSSLWRGQAWNSKVTQEKGRLCSLERQLSRIRVIKADVRQLERMAEDKLRRENKNLSSQRDEELKNQRKLEVKEKLRICELSQSSTVRGRSLSRRGQEH